MSNYHNHWHFHQPGRYYSLFPEERHDGGWHEHAHQHLHRVPDDEAMSDHRHFSPHGHDHISSEHTIQPEPPDGWSE